MTLVVDVAGLSYRYPDGNLALSNITFQLRQGERLGLVGPNGAGKTTLLFHLNGILPGDGIGTDAIKINELPARAQNVFKIRSMVGVLFQDPDDQLFGATVREDVAFGPLNLKLPKAEVLSRVEKALKDVGMGEAMHRIPYLLSLGEKRRVCLAGVLACQPEILVLDEPSANLDPRSRRQLLQILRDCPAAQLIATHDLELIAEHCPRVIVLDEGCIQADGPTSQILRDARLMERHGLEVPYSMRLPRSISETN